MNESSTFLIHSPREMTEAGAALAHAVYPRASRAKKALVIGLRGELGSGKTTFVQGFMKALGIQKHVGSPTFVLMNIYRIPGRGEDASYRNAYHIDCYRMESSSELRALGWNEIIGNPDHIVLVEWPDRARDILPPDTLMLAFAHKGQEHVRTLTVSS